MSQVIQLPGEEIWFRSKGTKMETPEYSSGTTPTERLLFRLCRESFLQLWSYANVFRDQGKRGAGDGKELCDVIVICGDAVILFSDKCCAFPETGNLDVDWCRWYRRAVEASQRQLAGAERWIKEFPDRVYSDQRCTQRLHVALPPGDRIRVFKVAVALGAAERYQSLYPECSGSLIQMKLGPTEQSILGIEPGVKPFIVPLCSKDGIIVHVVDDVTLPVLLRELDTISDFVEYLETKEQIIRKYQSLFVFGEEELMGLFLGVRARLLDSLEDSAESGSIMMVPEGIYKDIINQAEYQSYVSENLSSYFWDDLISYHTKCFFDGTLIEGSSKTVAENESVLKILAQESRVHRRLLANAYLDLMAKAPRDEITSRTVTMGDDKIYVFQVNPQMGRDFAEYQRMRQNFLHQYCILTGWRNRDKKLVVGMTTDGGNTLNYGFCIMAIAFDEWTPDMVAAGESLYQEMTKDVLRPPMSGTMEPKHTTPWKDDSFT